MGPFHMKVSGKTSSRSNNNQTHKWMNSIRLQKERQKRQASKTRSMHKTPAARSLQREKVKYAKSFSESAVVGKHKLSFKARP